MILLAIDTCGGVGSVAITKCEPGSLQVLAYEELAGKTFSLYLVDRIQKALAVTGLALSEVDAVVVVNGPGSFTGVRIGVSAAKALAETMKKPLLAVSRLDVLASVAGVRQALLDAGRGEFYFRKSVEPAEESLVTPEELQERLLAGEKVAICEESLTSALPEDSLARVVAPTAADACGVAFPRLAAGDFDDIEALDANYLRRSDAEIYSKPKLDAALQS